MSEPEEWKGVYLAHEQDPDVTFYSTLGVLAVVNMLLDNARTFPIGVGWHLEDVKEGFVHFHMTTSNGGEWCWTFEKVS